MSLIRRPPARPSPDPLARAWWLAGVADPAWLAVALTVVARALGVADPARALISTLALVPDGGPMRGSDPPAEPVRTPASEPDPAHRPEIPSAGAQGGTGKGGGAFVGSGGVEEASSIDDPATPALAVGEQGGDPPVARRGT